MSLQPDSMLIRRATREAQNCGLTLSRDLKSEEIQPWARAAQKEREGIHQTALQTCLPIGPLNSVGTLDQEITIVQTPSLIVILYGNLTYRQVFDGRSPEKLTAIPVGWAIRLGIGRARRWSSRAMVMTTEPGSTLKATRTATGYD